MAATTISGDRVVDLARRMGIGVPTWASPDEGRVDLTTRLGGTLGAPTASGTATLRDLRVAGSAAISADVPFSADPRRVSIARAGATAGQNTMTGDATLFQRADMVEASWQIVSPVLDVWRAIPARDFPNYESGSWGPDESEQLLAQDNRKWKNTVD